jgi:hypothetical protein
VVQDPVAKHAVFEDLTLDQLHHRDGDGWGSVLKALDAVQRCEGLGSVAVTKILHRKRPRLVPISDSLVREFYGLRGGYGPLFEAVHRDVVAHGDWLDDLRRHRATPDGLRMSRLRALDIVVWMHKQSCTSA